MDAVGDYFSWAFHLGFAGVVVMGLVIPAVVLAFALLAAGNLIVWLLVALKFMGREAREGARRGWSKGG